MRFPEFPEIKSLQVGWLISFLKGSGAILQRVNDDKRYSMTTSNSIVLHLEFFN